MTPRIKTLLWSAVGCYAVVRGYQHFRNPSPDELWLTPYVFVMTAGLAFYAAVESYRNKSAPVKRLSPSDIVGRKTIGVFQISIGLAFLVLACWVTRDQWIRLTRWPHVNAVLISKDISRGGARMIFRYEVRGYQVTGLGFRWGDEKTVRAALESYEPGTVHRISYDPEDPRRVETVISYSWESVKSEVFGIALGALIIAGGVYNYWRPSG
jgi:hypothetical protein